VTHPQDLGDDTLEVLCAVLKEAENYLAEIQGNVSEPGGEKALEAFNEPLPDEGMGASNALRRLIEQGLPAHARSTGPRFFHFVMGGVTPAAMGADWLTSLLDQNPGMWIGSPMGARLEQIALSWLRDLFGLPEHWGGKLTSGATMANYTCLAAARRWWGLQQGADVDEEGLAGLPQVPVFSSGYVHASSIKALGMLGIGRSRIETLSADATGRLDLEALDEALRKTGPAIVIANAGEVNAGDFDPIDQVADLCEEHGAWLHVDGAFGLFAAASPTSDYLVKGVDRADSVTADGHKWLNVPYDCGFAFIKDPSLPAEAFSIKAAYLAPTDPSQPNLGFIGPESSQRARAFTVWATLTAYGRSGYRSIVERHLQLAKRLGDAIAAAEELELLAEVKLNIVCFRYNPGGLTEEELDAINAEAGRRLIEDGRVYAGTTKYAGRTAFRPAIVNWRTTESDVDLLVDVVREIGTSVDAAR
jgi:glutamate/tyrosine decarboxylase-like PLP-dependent enzyme